MTGSDLEIKKKKKSPISSKHNLSKDSIKTSSQPNTPSPTKYGQNEKSQDFQEKSKFAKIVDRILTFPNSDGDSKKSSFDQKFFHKMTYPS